MDGFGTLPVIGGNLFLLLFVGLGAGVLSGFAGVGGAFIVTPALIIIGFPASFAVGTGLAWVVGKSVIAALSHGKLGNVDIKLGVIMLIATSLGTEAGVRLLNQARDMGLADEVVLSVSVCMLLGVGTYTLIESMRRKRELDRLLKTGQKAPPAMRSSGISRKLQGIRLPPMVHFPRSQITISLWIVLGIGLFVGTLAGLMGVGGGFIMVPALVYLIGIPSFMAVGTDLFQIVFTASYGTIRHTMSGNVMIYAAFLMVLASTLGVQYGVIVTRFVRGVSVRYILGISIILCAAGAILKLVGILLGDPAGFEMAAISVTFGSLWLTVMMILGLFIMAMRYRKGKGIPSWAQSFVATDTE